MADQVRELVIKVTVDADAKPLEQVGQSADATSTKAVALGTVIGNLVTGLADMAFEAVKAGAAMAKDLVFGVAEAADEIAKTSSKLGVASDQLQRLRGAAELSGAATKDLDSGLRDLQKNLGEAIQKGAGPAVEALGALGLEVADVESLLAAGDVEGALGLIGDEINKLGDNSQRQAVQLKLFGGAGAELGTLLEAGTEGIAAMGDRISATGEVISADALPAFEAMQDNLRDITGRVEGAKRTIAIALAPAVSDIADRIETWIDSNQDFIQQDLPAILESVANSAITLTEFTIDLLTSWREFSRDASDLAEIMTSDVDPAMGGVSDTLSGMSGIADGLALALADITVQFLEAVGAGEELIQIFREIRTAVAGDDGPKGQRGAPGFIGGGSSLVNQGDIKSADASGDTSKLRTIAADPRFSEGDRAKVAAQADKIDAREAAKAEKEAADARAKRQQDIEASRGRARTAQRQQRRAKGRAAPRTGGGGGAPTETIDDLLTAAVGGAAPSALRSATSALSGTLLVRVENNNSVSLDVGQINVQADLPEDVAPSIVTELRGTVSELQRQNREAFEAVSARGNLGF